ncbi:hypothetical protein GOODEAATRI_030508 [Goodea atripinnis]|uniref:Uncharacterized protein n=1 Tax=Goodea atripinnis TaxID=208336 RepID=A0ABV0N5L6_9TELE
MTSLPDAFHLPSAIRLQRQLCHVIGSFLGSAFCALTFWLYFVPCRIVSIFQRMLSLALEADRSPALNSAKLSQELFHMVLSHMPLRAHR